MLQSEACRGSVCPPPPQQWCQAGAVLTCPVLSSSDERLDLEEGRWDDVHVITGALKLFFRELPEPLFPFSHFDKFIAAISKKHCGGG